MDWCPVSSSRMRAVAWEEDKMYIQFNNGVIYCYENVDKFEYEDFLNSPSLGKALNEFQHFHPYYKV